jgi:hypothetical protein
MIWVKNKLWLFWYKIWQLLIAHQCHWGVYHSKHCFLIMSVQTLLISNYTTMMLKKFWLQNIWCSRNHTASLNRTVQILFGFRCQVDISGVKLPFVLWIYVVKTNIFRFPQLVFLVFQVCLINHKILLYSENNLLEWYHLWIFNQNKP